MNKTPLEAWILSKVKGMGKSSFPNEGVEAYQLEKIQKTLKHAIENSVFYAKKLQHVAVEEITSLAAMNQLPFTFPHELAESPGQFLCVSQDEIQRIVTLKTSGTTNGEGKRLFFTKEEQADTVDFFAVGMSTFVKEGDRVLILLPGDQPGSVGDLLKQALEKIQVGAYLIPWQEGPESILSFIKNKGIHCVVGLPIQLWQLIQSPFGQWGSIVEKCLLTADYVPQAVIHELANQWQCDVFTHYGMTEMGLGGGVECEALRGYHLREADLYFEVVDPQTGLTCKPGEWGEVVFTTLTRKGMPLIRYRTGDISRLIDEACPCGSFLRRLDQVQGRLEGEVELNSGQKLSICQLDEVLFQFPQIADYNASILSEGENVQLQVALKVKQHDFCEIYQQVHDGLLAIPALHILQSGNKGRLHLTCDFVKNDLKNGKRKIVKIKS